MKQAHHRKSGSEEVFPELSTEVVDLNGKG
jgi:hypothetical protein